MRILVATDAWHPQVNGVVNTYEHIREIAPRHGVALEFLKPDDFFTIGCPTYPQIRLALSRPSKVRDLIARKQPDFIHIATEGPIGVAARRYCVRQKKPFTSSYHTRFPEYVSARAPVPLRVGYAYERWFHSRSRGMMVVTPSLAEELRHRGFKNVQPWSRGVNTALFKPRPVRLFGKSKVFLYVGRVAVEKNVEAFLSLRLDGVKVVVGDGPQLETLKSKYPDAIFAGPKYGEDLAECYASADVLVFPSLTDTFGNVMLEGLAAGLPVAAYPVTGPKDLITDARVGVLDHDLARAVEGALSLDTQDCRAFAMKYSWRRCLWQFLKNILDANAAAKKHYGALDALSRGDPCLAT